MNDGSSPPTSWRQRAMAWRDLAMVLSVCALTIFLYLGGPLLWDRDEPRNAGCAREMMARGDWIVPTFNGELRSQKPVLLYWLIIGAYQLWGVTEFSARVASAVLGTGTVCLVYFAGRRLFDRSAGLWSAIILATSLMFIVASRAATPDAALLFFTTAALLWFVVRVAKPLDSVRTSRLSPHDGASANPDNPRAYSMPRCFFDNVWHAIVFYALLGLAVLAKGPVGLVIPLAVVGMWMLVMRSPAVTAAAPGRRSLSRYVRWLIACCAPAPLWQTGRAMRPGLGVMVVLVVAGPWYVAVGLQTQGVFLQEFLLRENLARATSTFENHSGGWWYYPAALLVGFFPWSVFAVPVTEEVRRRWIVCRDPIVVFLALWIAVQVGVFSLASTKLPSYVTPCYPALALLAGWALSRWDLGSHSVAAWAYRLGLPAAVLAGLVIILSAAYAGERYVAGDRWLGLLGLPLVLGAVVAWWWSQPRVYAVASVLFAVIIFSWGALRVDGIRRGHPVLQALREAPSPTRVFSFRALESSWVYYGEKPIVELPSDLDGLTQPEGAGREAEWFIDRSTPLLIITTDEHQAALLERFEGDLEVVADGPYFTRTSRIVLLARRPSRVADRDAEPASSRR